MRRASPREKRLLSVALARWRRNQLPNGIPKKYHLKPRDFDPVELAIGVGVEMEHTNRPEVAVEIAMAHLHERGDYYVLLEKMEKAPHVPMRSHAKKGARDLTREELLDEYRRLPSAMRMRDPGGYDVLRYTSGKSYIAPAEGRPDYRTVREAEREAEKANAEWHRRGRPSLVQEMSQFFAPASRDGHARAKERARHRMSSSSSRDVTGVIKVEQRTYDFPQEGGRYTREKVWVVTQGGTLLRGFTSEKDAKEWAQELKEAYAKGRGSHMRAPR